MVWVPPRTVHLISLVDDSNWCRGGWITSGSARSVLGERIAAQDDVTKST